MDFFEHLNDDVFVLGFIGHGPMHWHGNGSIFSWLEVEVERFHKKVEQLYGNSLVNILNTNFLEEINRQHKECLTIVGRDFKEKMFTNKKIPARAEVITMFEWAAIGILFNKQTTHKSKNLIIYLIGKELLEKSKKTKKLSSDSVIDFESWLSIYNFNIHFLNVLKNCISDTNSQSATKRHEPSRKTKLYAISLFQQINEQKSVKSAVRTFYKDVIEYGKTKNFIFTDEIQAFDTIYHWILKYKKSKK
jgi:hypothetical protein